MDVGGIGGLRNVKNVISVARKVLEHTEHSLLVGSLATDFAVKMGFKQESLQTNESKEMWTQWKANKCQPNFWKVLREVIFFQYILFYDYFYDIFAVFRMLYQIQQVAVDHIAQAI